MHMNYHSALKKYKNYKIKDKKEAFFVPADNARNRPVFKPLQDAGILIPVYVLVWYILAGTVGTGMILTTLV